MNPFKEKPARIQSLFTDREKNYPKPYDKNAVDPYVAIRSAYLQNQQKYRCRFAEEEQAPSYDFDFDIEE